MTSKIQEEQNSSIPDQIQSMFSKSRKYSSYTLKSRDTKW